ncbi:hypothetical protein TNCT_468601 [Trichonephila clavata]|uniref:Uncharacterized protein n=1 Tax=Trichonephila clavata TaxID=2740835 RepID=A0A8X6LGT4_TRICU|nr:hypothetical protein TNCT_468601 [Trichonephila clavata]
MQSSGAFFAADPSHSPQPPTADDWVGQTHVKGILKNPRVLDLKRLSSVRMPESQRFSIILKKSKQINDFGNYEKKGNENSIFSINVRTEAANRNK